MTLIRLAGLDFLWSGAFWCENPRLCRLDFLGFPWILSSESRLINGLRGILREKFFLSLFPRRGRFSNAGIRFWRAEGAGCSHRAKLILISDFLQ
jgi:hypothetical protein